MAKNEPKELRVESILQAAVEEFIIKGYDGASIDAIAKRAGVSKGGFYYHFPNKEVLLLEANAKLSEPIAIMMGNAMMNVSPMNGLRQFSIDYLNYWVSRPKEMSFYALSMSKALESPMLMEFYREYVKESTAFFVGMFQRAVELGETDIIDVEAYGISLMGALDGIALYAIVNPQSNMDELAERFSKIWLTKKNEG